MSHMMADSASINSMPVSKLMKYRQGSIYCIWTTQCVIISLSWQTTAHLWAISWESYRNCRCAFRSCNWNSWLFACEKCPQILAQNMFLQTWTGPRLASMYLSTGILHSSGAGSAESEAVLRRKSANTEGAELFEEGIKGAGSVMSEGTMSGTKRRRLPQSQWPNAATLSWIQRTRLLWPSSSGL